MAKVSFDFPMSNKLGDYSIYRMKGSKKFIIRSKGGASKRKIKTAPEFEDTRQNNKEFGGRSTTASNIRKVLIRVNHLADYNFINGLRSLANDIQKMDVINQLGQRCL